MRRFLPRAADDTALPIAKRSPIAESCGRIHRAGRIQLRGEKSVGKEVGDGNDYRAPLTSARCEDWGMQQRKLAILLDIFSTFLVHLAAMKPEANILGAFLKNARSSKELTLRAVEEATGISNAYLSQLEGGKIQKPSPAVLYKLCELYGASYTTTLEYAGHPVPRESLASSARSAFASRIGQTTKEEEEALLEYLEFLRSKRKRG